MKNTADWYEKKALDALWKSKDSQLAQTISQATALVDVAQVFATLAVAAQIECGHDGESRVKP